MAEQPPGDEEAADSDAAVRLRELGPDERHDDGLTEAGPDDPADRRHRGVLFAHLRLLPRRPGDEVHDHSDA